MDVDDLLGSGTEEAIYKQSFEQGFSDGSGEGAEDGWRIGLKTGASIGFELGRYKGFAVAVRENFSKTTGADAEGDGIGNSAAGEDSKGKVLRLCDRIIKSVEEFDFENVSSVQDATSQIRSQFTLLKANLGINSADASKTKPEGQKYSF